MGKTGYVYILTNFTNTTFYVGVTSNLTKRLEQHRNGEGSKFTTKYNLFKLVYVESTSCMLDAIDREKQLKSWKREWKIDLIKENNPEFKDLITEWFGDGVEKSAPESEFIKRNQDSESSSE